MRVASIPNQNSNSRPVAFGATRFVNGAGRPRSAFQSVIAAENLTPESNFSFIVFEFKPDKKINIPEENLQAVLDEKGAFQIGVRQYKDPQCEAEVYMYHKNIFNDDGLKKLFVQHWETIQKLLNSLANFGNIGRAQPSERKMVQRVLLGDVYKCKAINLDDGPLKINQIAAAMSRALDQIAKKLKVAS